MLLEAARAAAVERFLQMSTDEVYGPLDSGIRSPRTRPWRPLNPYAASKAAATAGGLATSTPTGWRPRSRRGSNNYGPNQHPEKLIPLLVTNALAGDAAARLRRWPQVRDWLYAAGLQPRDRHRAGERRAGRGLQRRRADNERPNLEVVRRILALCGRDESLIEYVPDRPGHDRRYSLSSDKVASLGWQPRVHFHEGLEQTVAWYRDNQWWWEPIRSGAYRDYYARQYGRELRA